MRLIRDITSFSTTTGYVVTLGNFDGMHIGHHQLLDRLGHQAKNLRVPSALISFEPLPMEFFLKDRADARLMTLREKIEFLQQRKIDLLVCLRFNQELAGWSAKQFVDKLLVERLQAKHLVVGDDCSFGSNREGGFELLEQYAAQGLFTVEQVSTVTNHGMRIGSSQIRQALALGDFVLAKELLGRPYNMSGRVVHGDHRGRMLGYPTANVYLRHKILPLHGVFVTKVLGLQKEPLWAVTNVGKRPTIDDEQKLLEAHILNFNQNIYGKRIWVEFVHKIRDEVKFASLEGLTRQIKNDLKQAKEYAGL